MRLRDYSRFNFVWSTAFLRIHTGCPGEPIHQHKIEPMLVKMHSSALNGVDAYPVTVEVSVDRGQGYGLAGLADETIRESWHRLHISLRSNGFQMPRTRITINLAPADIRKTGAAFDLPMALGILAASGQLNGHEQLDDCLVLGELGLDGSVYPVRGVLPMTIMAWKNGLKRIFVPEANAREAAMVKGVQVFGIRHLTEIIEYVEKGVPLVPVSVNVRETFAAARCDMAADFREVRGQQAAKRALEIAAAGGHNALMIGPPGAGKTMLATRFPGILPPFSLAEALETTKIYSVAENNKKIEGLISNRPFRQPHHTISEVALVGGGPFPMPGEISLAHHGVLFLDELPEFRRQVLEVLRQPLEERFVHISRARMSISFPCSFLLLASMNPCPCGYLHHPLHACRCTTRSIQAYRQKISGPLMDRIDLHIAVPPVNLNAWQQETKEESSTTIRARVIKAREIQAARFGKEGPGCNAWMTGKQLADHTVLDSHARSFFLKKMQMLQLSARAHDRVLKLGRTIADLAGSPWIELEHLAEALSYRHLDQAAGTNDFPTSKKLTHAR